MSSKTIITLICLGALLFVFFTGRGENDETKILALIEELRSNAEISTPLKQFEALERSGVLAKRFVEKTEFDVKSAGYGIVTNPNRNSLRQKIAHGLGQLKKLEIDVDDIELTLEDSTASANLKVSVLGELKNGNFQFLDQHLVEAYFEKINEEWFITGGQHLENLRGKDGLLAPKSGF